MAHDDPSNPTCVVTPTDVVTASDTRTIPEEAHPTITALLRGILDDALALIRQQFAMFKAELRADLNRVKNGVILLAAGVGPLALGGLMLCFMLVHLIHWATLPEGIETAATIPLWGCYGIVAGLFLIIGGGLLGAGIYKLKSANPLPDESTHALEENIQWLMNRK